MDGEVSLARYRAASREVVEAIKPLAKVVERASIDEVYDAAIAAGALAGKVSGAGGGGFMMFFVDPARRPDVMRTLAEFNGQVFTCNFTESGAQSWRKA